MAVVVVSEDPSQSKVLWTVEEAQMRLGYPSNHSGAIESPLRRNASHDRRETTRKHRHVTTRGRAKKRQAARLPAVYKLWIRDLNLKRHKHRNSLTHPHLRNLTHAASLTQPHSRKLTYNPDFRRRSQAICLA